MACKIESMLEPRQGGTPIVLGDFVIKRSEASVIGDAFGVGNNPQSTHSRPSVIDTDTSHR